ncbi:MAG: hypothetical protein KatS3mg031_2950 [Chitinophagales bacterium]|nr:MAG: hypothetical protein KatS3mg031_2950 [Chitinophagales bacterium]
MKTTIRLTGKGFQHLAYTEKSVMVFFGKGTKPLSASVNELPKSVKEEIGEKMPETVFGQKYLGNGKVFNVFRGNCAGAWPYQFRNIDDAVEAFKRVRHEGETGRVFSGNLWIGNIINDVFQPLEKPIAQLL